LIPANENHSFEYQLFPRLLQNNENFRAFIAENNYWLDIGTPQRYLQAHYDLIAGKIRNLGETAAISKSRAPRESTIFRGSPKAASSNRTHASSIRFWAKTSSSPKRRRAQLRHLVGHADQFAHKHFGFDHR
jgi:NDP-sugar pyrophosphorylase family protein